LLRMTSRCKRTIEQLSVCQRLLLTFVFSKKRKREAEEGKKKRGIFQTLVID